MNPTRKTLALSCATAAGVLAILAAPVSAQEATGAPILLAQSTMPAQTSAQVDADKLIGRTVKNAQDESIGDINSVMLGANGRAESVIVGVGGFLGIGEHEVALGWNNLVISDNGETVRTSLTKDQLKALPEYRYAENSQRGTVFTGLADKAGELKDKASEKTTEMVDKASEKTSEMSDRAGKALSGIAPSSAPATISASGSIGASEIVGLNIADSKNESVGEVKDLMLKSDGSAQAAIVAVGGVLGIGEHRVLLSWEQIQLKRENGKLKATVAMSKDQLKALPEYKVERAEAPRPASSSPASPGGPTPMR